MRVTGAKTDNIDVLKHRKGVTIPELSVVTGTGMKAANDLATQAEAVYYIGRRKFANLPKVLAYIDSISE